MLDSQGELRADCAFPRHETILRRWRRIQLWLVFFFWLSAFLTVAAAAVFKPEPACVLC
jgi:hypothetical protein